MEQLTPLPVALPLIVAAVLLALGQLLPRGWADAISVVTAAAVGVVAVFLAKGASGTPLAYWYGGWTPRDGVAIGIAFVVDPAGAGSAAFTAVLFSFSFVFSWGYFEEVQTRYHALMLIFLAALTGFALTGDLFNFFVFFELMSTVAFALTGYKLESSALEGALNFTVTNAVGGFMMLAGIGLLYGRTGALNFAQLHQALAEYPANGLLALAVALIFGALFIKGAIFPFHFWIADAHSVAPTPVCAIFSGIMVPIALFGAARLYWRVFSGSALEHALLQPLLVWLGTATAAIGGLVALMQRDAKRLLAMSTFGHMGVILVGIGLLSAQGLAGSMLYVVGHGLTKAGLFLIAGIMLSILNGIDELQLRGAGKGLPITGAAYMLGGLILAGLPVGLMHQGSDLIGAAAHSAGYGFLPPMLSGIAGLTGAAILRSGARIFLGLGPEPGVEAVGPSEQDQEKPNHPIWLMLLPALAVVATALVLQAFPVEEAAGSAAAKFVAAGSLPPDLLSGHAEWPSLSPPPAAPNDLLEPMIGLSIAVLIAAFELGRAHFPPRLTRASDLITGPVFLALDQIHNGVVTDYVAWLMFGTIVLGSVVVIG